ncbi:ferritin [Patescibacteria group bacterium]
MKLSKKMQQALNEQINAELYSAYIYLSMSAYFEKENLSGFAQWMRMQASEEQVHAMKIYDYINERGGEVMLTSIAQPKATWKSPLDVFQEAHKHEQHVTKLIYNLVNIAKSEDDKATDSFLEWFIDEQVEEEASAEEIVGKLQFINGDPSGLMFLDEKLGERQVEEEVTTE